MSSLLHEVVPEMWGWLPGNVSSKTSRSYMQWYGLYGQTKLISISISSKHGWSSPFQNHTRRASNFVAGLKQSHKQSEAAMPLPGRVYLRDSKIL